MTYSIITATEVSKFYGDAGTFSNETAGKSKTFKDAKVIATKVEREIEKEGFRRIAADMGRGYYKVTMLKKDGEEATFKTISISKD